MQPTDYTNALQKVSVLVGSIVSSFLYCHLRASGVEVSNMDKFWCALPFFTAMVVTDRCVVAKLILHAKRLGRIK
jgi:hypothetical protein